MHLYVATTNPGKLRDFGQAFTLPHLITPLANLAGIPAPPEDEPTFAANALAKATYYSSFAPGLHVLADDSGLEVDALGGAPGVRSARFADDRRYQASRPLPVDQRNNLCLLDALASTRAEARSARYVCALALVRDGQLIASAEGSTEGEILAVPRGTQGFGYDPLFLLPDEGLTMGEMSPAQRQQHSHRARALARLVTQL